jgi:hypothetical protein
MMVVAYIDEARDDCCAKGLHAYAPHVVISKIDSSWAAVSVQSKDTSGHDLGGTEFVLYRMPAAWVVFNGPGSDGLGCGVPNAIEKELHLSAAPHCLPAYINCGSGRPQVKPSSLGVACGDGNFFVTDIKWSLWSPAWAMGTGVGHLNDCKPYCAAGHFHTYPVAVKLGRTNLCGKKHVLYFTHLTTRFTATTPKGSPRSSQSTTPCRLP